MFITATKRQQAIEREGQELIQFIDIVNRVSAEQIWHLQQRSYRIEAELIGWEDLPPLRESVEDLMACGETFAVFWEEGDVAGAISYKRLGDTLDIHRMMVDPGHFRKGIASRLLQFAENAQTGVAATLVSTGALNEPAINLYKRHGFILSEEKEVAPGLKLAFLRKEGKQ